MGAQDDRIDLALADYERRKQEETRRQVQRSLRLEEARKKGVECLRKYAVEPARDVAARLQAAGHKVLHQEFMDAYPPNICVHFWPKPGPLETEAPQRHTLELVWGDPEPEALCTRRWTPAGRETQGSARLPGRESSGTILFTHEPVERPPSGDVLDDLWVKEQLLIFVRETLHVGNS